MGQYQTDQLRIAGASFSIHPMSDHFVDIILGALDQTDTSKVWLDRDDVTTTIRGKTAHVFDVTSAAFLHAAKTGKHVAFNATYSIVGCPFQSEGTEYLDKSNTRLNEENVQKLQQPVAAKFALYPIGDGDYMDVILKQIEEIKQYVTVTPDHYSTRLDGETVDVFKGLEQVLHATDQSGASHIVMTVSISANSPSHEK